MSLASAAGALLKRQTPLQQLLEDINFQRTKELRQLLKDDSGFVVLQGTTYWTDLFVRHFLFQTEPVHSIDSDDLLFFVRKKHVKSSSRHMPKYETEVDVFRKDSRKLPIGDPDVDWEETVYLNMVIHQFDYTLTLAICTRTSPKELQVLRRHSQRVYASPSRRKMDTKGDGEEITYPHICFMVDNFDEVFSDILVRDGEMVCVELVANDKDGAVQGVIFLGSIRYDALKKVYDARQSSLSSKVAQRMSFGLFSSGAGVQTRCEFVRMKGPQGKGHAEMAVTKPKGSGVETPTSEPGFCATDMWDDWDDENDDYCNYRHQRRLSDPSANLNNFSRNAWRTKSAQDASGGAGAKARSENEGLDTLANEVSEIEAGDLRDDLRPAFSASEAKLHINPKCELAHDTALATTTQAQTTDMPKSSIDIINVVEATAIVTPTPKSNTSTTGCGNCFGGKKCKRWVSSAHTDKNTPQMSEVYCPTCDDATNETPACLNKMPDKRTPTKPKSLLSVDNELLVTKRGCLRQGAGKVVTRSLSLNSADRKTKKVPELNSTNTKKDKLKLKEKTKDNSKEKVTTTTKITKTNLLAKVSPKRLRNKFTEKTKSNQCQQRNNKANNNILVIEEKVIVTTTTELTEDDIKSQEYEIADDACENLNCSELCTSTESGAAKMAILSERDPLLTISVRGREELPVVEEPTITTVQQSVEKAKQEQGAAFHFEKCANNVPVKIESHPLEFNEDNETSIADFLIVDNNLQKAIKLENIVEDDKLNDEHDELTPMLRQQSDCNGNCEASATVDAIVVMQQQNGGVDDVTNLDSFDDEHAQEAEATLLRKKRSLAQQAFYDKALNIVPKRRTPDGTNIYYWCDLPRKALKELDDGAYNPLWASRGFTQSFHFWKENRRQQSTPLNAFLTYVTLPWWSIAKDLLDHRETPILTF